MESNAIMEIDLDAQQIAKSIWDIIVCQISVFSQCVAYVATICYKVTSNVTMAMQDVLVAKCSLAFNAE